MTRRANSTVNIALFLILQGLLGASSPMAVVFVRFGAGSWSLGGREFSIAQNFDLLETKTSSLVMVSFTPGSKFGASLEQKEGLIAYYSSMVSGVGRALVSLDSSEEVDQLALLAHQDIGLCGAIERFNPALTNISLSDAASPAIATSIKSQAVSELLSSVTAANLQSTVEALENLGTRHHSASSSDASSSVESLWQPLLPSGASITKVSHTDYTQKSVLLKIPGTDTTAKTIILGAHLDSINPTDNQNAPGADDDASGIAALTEVLRIIKTSGATFARPVELRSIVN
ncbi:MAG: M28 family peptidase [bacterium]